MSSLSFGPIHGTGAGSVVFIMGFVLNYFNIAPTLGSFGMYAGIIVAMLYLALGILSTIIQIVDPE